MMALLYRYSLLFVLILIGTTDASNKAVGRLQRNVKFLLQSVLDIKLDISNLYETVNDLQNTSLVETAGPTDRLSTSMDISNTDIQNTTVFVNDLKDELKLNMKVLRQGFGDEKEILRQQLNSQKEQLDDFITLMQGTVSKHANLLNDMEQQFSIKIQKSENILNNTRFRFENKTNHIVNDVEKMHNEMIETIRNNSLQTYAGFEKIEQLSIRMDEIESHLNTFKQYQSKVLDHSVTIASKMEFLELSNIEGFTKYGDSLYKVYGEIEPWLIAKEICDLKNGYLVEIKDYAELQFLAALVDNMIIWNGATDVGREGDWRWDVSGEPVDKTLWSKGEPNNVGHVEHCGQTQGFAFNDNSCQLKFAFVCEFTKEHLLYKRMLELT